MFAVASLGIFARKISSSDLHPKIQIEKIGIIADIHAASQQLRKASNEENIVHPNDYTTVLPETLDKIKNEKADAVIDLGDHTNNSSRKHATNIRQMIEGKGFLPVWVKGNHDSDGAEDDDEGEFLESKENDETNIMKVLGAPGRYYYFDRGNWRIIVLDSSEEPGEVFYQGGLSVVQIDWLKKALDNEKDVLVAMHHPIFDKETRQYVYPIYENLEKIFSQSGNVKYVFSGHWHTPYWEKEYNGIRYFGIPALTLESQTGFYKIIELPSLYYDSYEPS
ncbi:MAG TPA: metallophosphoesterase [Patescibacteria group bacterium]|nr:metallophosphoesterase [Patescibacteria group bacterium]